jgi:hypothetical protein
LPLTDTLTKVYSQRAEREINYTTPNHILQELGALESQVGWSIFKELKLLKDRKADSFSFTKDRPFHYLFARITEENIIIRLRTDKRDVEFSLPIASLEK